MSISWSLHRAIGALYDPFTLYGINYALDANNAVWLPIQRKVGLNWYEFHCFGSSIVLEVPLRYLRPSTIYSVPCDRILQRAHYRIKLDEVKKLLDSWFWRHLSIMGKIQVIKSPAVSKFVHLLTTLPTPYDSFLKELETLFVIKKMGDCRWPIFDHSLRL